MKILTLILLIFISGCKSEPTKIKEDVGGEADRKVIVVDTRSALEYSSFHVPGSVNLNTQDFIILQNPLTKKRVLDPDLEQFIERLARRGISPLKTVKLVSSAKDSEENKKWQWMLGKLDVVHVELYSQDDYIKANRPLRPKPEPTRVDVWPVANKALILKNADKCFVNWSDNCL